MLDKKAKERIIKKYRGPDAEWLLGKHFINYLMFEFGTRKRHWTEVQSCMSHPTGLTCDADNINFPIFLEKFSL